MEQPQHSVRRVAHPSWYSPGRLTALAASTAIVIGFGWALSTGLAQTIIEKLPEVLKAEVVPQKLPDKTPPPPPPDLKAPPPPYVPPPDIVIQTESAPTNTITTQSKVATPPPISSPASIGRPHVCLQDYPAISQRLGEEGTTLLAFHITAEGSVTNVTVAKSSGSERLDNAAVNCASSWRYKPAVEAGHPVEVPWRAEVQWVLH
ncbi:MAG: energy transducer TonB [Alphaproteobacteria bacterium]|nr:TonB family protein [Alphaproteobacteria bacterium]MDE2112387.1 energy transducer TonB [Alphaproteobacteria bacterium]MDE2495312.1 energy transducer TonB [Alphaproteobacteria bacterium]